MSELRQKASEALRAMSDVSLQLRKQGRSADADVAARLHDQYARWAVQMLDRFEAGAPVISLERERRRRERAEGEAG